MDQKDKGAGAGDTDAIRKASSSDAPHIGHRPESKTPEREVGRSHVRLISDNSDNPFRRAFREVFGYDAPYGRDPFG